MQDTFVFQPRKPIRYKSRAGVAPASPRPPAVVVSTSYGSSGMGGWAQLTFDQPVPLSAGATPDDAITFSAGYVATAVSQVDAVTLRFELSTGVYSGAPWNVNRQPAWVTAPLANPASGTF